MKVLHVIPSVSHVHGGPSRAIRTIQRALRERGIDTLVATSDDDGRGRRSSRPLGSIVSEEEGERIYFRKIADAYTFTGGLTGWLWRHVRDYDACHVHALFSFSSTAASIVALARGVPLIVRPLGTLNEYGVNRRRPFAKRLSLSVLERPILRRAAAVHCTSTDEASDVLKLEPKARTVVIPLAVVADDISLDAARAEFPDLADRPLVLFLSRLDPKKNIEALLEAWREVSVARPDAQLVIAGSGEAAYVASLHELAERAGEQGSVIWPGHVEGARKAALFRLARCFVLPSFSENFGIAAAEALAAGLPCIVSPGVALASAIATADAGQVVEPSPAQLATAMRKYLDDDELRDQQGDRARRMAQAEFSEPVMAERLAALYATVIAKPGDDH